MAAQRARFHDERPRTSTGDVDAERRLYASLSRGVVFRALAPTGIRTRTAFFDHQVMTALADGVGQVVIVGAGYDGRAFRFSQRGVRWFEVDHPATQPDKKHRALSAGADLAAVTYLPLDLLAGDVADELQRCGHDRHRASLFICEGLFSYLPNAECVNVCERLAIAAGPGSRLAASFLVRQRARTASAQGVVDRLLRAIGEPRLGHFGPGDPGTLFTSTGWVPSHTARTPTSRMSGTHLLLLAGRRP